jgi:hypothetical protein
MAMNIQAELKRLGALTTPQLRAKYAELFGEATRCNNRPYLIKRICWRLQADAEGDLSERARQRAVELADDANLRLQAPSPHLGENGLPKGPVAPNPHAAIASIRMPRKSIEPMPGTTLHREYKGRHILVIVRPKGFEYEDTVYRSLSAVANAITGSHWNGMKFFAESLGLDEATGGRVAEAAV